jgi:hypothetical protein
MATSFSVGRSRSTRWEPPTMGKQLVYSIFICLPILTQFWMNCIESFRQYVDGFPLSFTVSEINLTETDQKVQISKMLKVLLFHPIFNYIMATTFSGGRSRSTWWEPPTMGKQLVNFITCGCESSAPFFRYLQSRARTHIKGSYPT